MPTEEMLIHELAKRTGTSVRTIRYYSDEGLLPPPIQRGKYAYYTAEHLRRLELIQRMKAAYLPLREIRQLLESQNDDEIELKLAAQSPPPVSPRRVFTESEAPGEDALEYINRLVNTQTSLRSTQNMDMQFMQPPEPFAEPQSEHWRRYRLTPQLELLVREPPSRKTQALIDQIMALLRATGKPQRREP